MKRSVRYLTGIVALLASESASAKDLPNYNAYQGAQPLAPASRPASQSVMGGRVSSMDEKRGVPSFFWAPPPPLSLVPATQSAFRSPEQAARAHLKKFAPLYGLSDAALGAAVVTKVHDLGHGGVVVTLRQELNGVELLHADMKVLMQQNLDVVALSGSLHPSLEPGTKTSMLTFGLSGGAALSAAFADLYGVKLSSASVVDTKQLKDRYHYFDLLPTSEVKASKLRFVEPARVKQVYFPLPDRIVPAYFVEFMAGDPSSTSSDAYSYVIAADDGRVLYRVNLTHADTFTYRVWADPAPEGRPLDGPIEEFSPHPTGKLDGSYPKLLPQSSLVAMDGFNNKHDPWLPAGATQTKGNNVDAYTDIAPPDGFSGTDIRATTTAPSTFDRVYDVTADPIVSPAQSMAAVTQIFYVTNWLHSWWYDSGFNEKAGNAQQDNYGRGGAQGDPLHAEAQDSAGNQSNNANMSAMSDGTSPRMQMYLWDGKAGPRLDGTIDNTVVAHEWGHYIHLRQVTSCNNQACGAESEGWGDFNALHMMVRPEDNLDGVFGVAIYATAAFANSGYYGIRRVPYSVDMAKNALTFKHITDGIALPTTHPVAFGGQNSEVHNAGEIWTMMLFEAYVALLKTSEGANPPHTFEQARRLMSDYIVGGLQLAPDDPTFTEQRDAILAAAAANDKADFAVLASAFARRGIGTCAVSPPRDSQNFAGVVESFEVSPEVTLLDFKIDDRVKSCDSDGKLDGGETGKVTLKIQNTGMVTLGSAKATVSSTTPGISFPNGTKVTFNAVPQFGTATANLDIALAETITSVASLDLSVTIDEVSPVPCTKSKTKKISPRINYDTVPSGLPVDNIEDPDTNWAADSAKEAPDDVWTREIVPASTNHVWHGVSLPSVADSTLESPPLEVSDLEDFMISFTHRYHFKSTGSTFFAGGVIEYSTDQGATWDDVINLAPPAPPAYDNAILAGSKNPLQGRLGFVGASPSWPAAETTVVNLGTVFVGYPVKIRFRIGAVDGQGDFGWELDDIGFAGITNQPFTVTVPDATNCAGVPIADAGPDQIVEADGLVTLDASKSSDPNQDPLTFTWTQVAGLEMQLPDPNVPVLKFLAPPAAVNTTLTFQVTVSDGKGSSADLVDVKVVPKGTNGTSSSASSGGANSSSASSSGASSSGASSSGSGGNGAGGAPDTSSSSSGKPADPQEIGGCGCSAVGSKVPVSAAPLLALLALSLRRRRRG